MKKNQKRLSLEKINKIKALYKKNWSYSKIGRFLRIHHTTVIYWVLRNFKITGKPISISKRAFIIRKKYKKRKPEPIIKVTKVKGKIEVKIKKEIDYNLCFKCQKEKTDEKWLKTHWCSLECFKSLYSYRCL